MSPEIILFSHFRPFITLKNYIFKVVTLEVIYEAIIK